MIDLLGELLLHLNVDATSIGVFHEGMIDLVARPVWVGTLAQYYSLEFEQAGLTHPYCSASPPRA